MTADVGPIGIVGFAALAVLVVGWLVISFAAPNPRRVVLEWLSATSLYVALLCFFLHLALRAHEAGNTLVLVAFIFLLVFFGGGLLVSLSNTFSALRGSGKTESSATN